MQASQCSSSLLDWNKAHAHIGVGCKRLQLLKSTKPAINFDCEERHVQILSHFTFIQTG